MTGENIRENIRDEILKAANLLAAADLPRLKRLHQ